MIYPPLEQHVLTAPSHGDDAMQRTVIVPDRPVHGVDGRARLVEYGVPVIRVAKKLLVVGHTALVKTRILDVLLNA